MNKQIWLLTECCRNWLVALAIFASYAPPAHGDESAKPQGRVVLKAPAQDGSRLTGEYYEAVVPDTLDLAERARLAVNAITGSADVQNNYEIFQCGHLDQQPPNFNHNHGGPCIAKAIDVIPMMRRMSGSKQNEDYDMKIINNKLRDVDEHGLWWIRVKDRPWRKGFGDDLFWPFPQGRLIVGLLAWHDFDQNPAWLPITETLVHGLHKVAGQNEQRAWFENSHTPRIELAAFAESYDESKQQIVGDSGPTMEYQFFMEAAPLEGGGSWSVDHIKLEYAEREKVVLEDDFTGGEVNPEKWTTLINAQSASIQQTESALVFENEALNGWNTMIVHSKESFPAVHQSTGLRMTLRIGGNTNAHYIVGLLPKFKSYPGRKTPTPPYGFHQSGIDTKLLYPMASDFSVPIDTDRQNSDYSIRVTLDPAGAVWEYDLHDGNGWREARKSDHGPLEPERVEMQVNGNVLRALSQWYAQSGDENTKQLAGKLSQFMLKPGLWGNNGNGPTMVDAYEHAKWYSHFHWFTTGVVGITDYATTVHDSEQLRYLQWFYEYSRQFGSVRIGFFPAVISPLASTKQGNKNLWGGTGQSDEACALAEMIYIAIKLSEAGVGDYWEDVDSMVRNHLVEHQLVDRERLKHIIAHSPKINVNPQIHGTDEVLERNIGSFVSCAEITKSYAWWTMCCNANAMMALYEAWDAIVRFDDGMAQVNLLLNRSSPWVDIDSYLPYEGKVVLKNKKARQISVRIPMWADKKAVHCKVNNEERPLEWVGRYLLVSRVEPKDTVTITFPMVETTEKHTERTYEQTYTCHFKGNTMIDISPRPEEFNWAKISSDDGTWTELNKDMGYPMYQRDHMKASKAPMKKVTRYVHSH